MQIPVTKWSKMQYGWVSQWPAAGEEKSKKLVLISIFKHGFSKIHQPNLVLGILWGWSGMGRSGNSILDGEGREENTIGGTIISNSSDPFA